jgi:hypothetical protein
MSKMGTSVFTWRPPPSPGRWVTHEGQAQKVLECGGGAHASQEAGGAGAVQGQWGPSDSGAKGADPVADPVTSPCCVSVSTSVISGSFTSQLNPPPSLVFLCFIGFGAFPTSNTSVAPTYLFEHV